jgi:hypothetical protein
MAQRFLSMRFGIGMALASTVLSAACSNLLGSEAGLPVPKDPGTVLARVRDQTGEGIAGALVEMHDIPNSVGSFYSISQRTRGDGTVEFTFIPAGRRRLQVTPPAGYRAGLDELIESVDVLKDATVRVTFVLSLF